MASWAPTPTPHHDVAPGFHIRYTVGASAHGQGLFAAHDIPAGTLLWKCAPGTTPGPKVNVLSFRGEAEARARLLALPESERAYWIDHVYVFSGSLNEILDDGKLWNHSETPCTGLPPSGDEYDFESSYAIRDIKAGEELLDDYGLYSYPDWYEQLCKEFGCPRDFVVKKDLEKVASARS